MTTVMISADGRAIPGLQYTPSAKEAERMALMAGCRMTHYKALVGGRVRVDDGAGARCPTCGGVHVVADVFDTVEQMRKALAHGQKNAMAYVGDGSAPLALLNADAGVTLKSLLGYDPNEGFAKGPAAGYVTKMVGNEYPGAITKG